MSVGTGRKSTSPPSSTTESTLAPATKVVIGGKRLTVNAKRKNYISAISRGFNSKDRSPSTSSHGSSMDTGTIQTYDEEPTPSDSRRHSSPVPFLSYDVHMGAGANNSADVLLRFQNDVERLKFESKNSAERVQCEMHAVPNTLQHVGAVLKRLDSVVDGYQCTERGYDLISASLLKHELVVLLEDGCAGALASLVPAGVELLRVVDEGFTVLFPRPARRRAGSSGSIVVAGCGVDVRGSCSSPAMGTRQSGTTLLDKTLDILARSVTIKRPSPVTTRRSPAKSRVRLHWTDKLVRRVAMLLSAVLTMEELAAHLEVSLDMLPAEVKGDPTDALFLVLEEWRQHENCQDVCPRLLDLLTEHAGLQAQLEELFEQWRRASEFLPTVISDRMLAEVARQIGDAWISVAYELNLGRSEIEQIRPLANGDGHDDDDAGAAKPVERSGVTLARGMLTHWRQTSGRYATRTVLAHALARCDLPDALERAGECSNSLPARSQLLSLVQDLMRSRRDTNAAAAGDAGFETTGLQTSASEHRRRRLAKKRINGVPIAESPGEQETYALATVPSALQESVTSPWEATSLVKSGPLFNVNLDDLPGRSDGSLVPLLVDKCIAFIEERGMTTRGIYRLSGISSAVTELEEKFAKDHNMNLFSVADERPERYDENCVASCLKAFLRKLPEPVVPAPITARFAEIPTMDHETESMVDRLKLIVVFGMEQRNRVLLQEICCHLQRVAEHASENLMKASNLAVVFWPTLLRPVLDTTDNMVLLRDLPRMLQNVMCLLIEHAEEIFIENQPW